MATMTYEEWVEAEAERRLAQREQDDAVKVRPALGRFGIDRDRSGEVGAGETELVDISERENDYRPQAGRLRASLQASGAPGALLYGEGQAPENVTRDGAAFDRTAEEYERRRVEELARAEGIDLPAEDGLSLRAQVAALEEGRLTRYEEAKARRLKEKLQGRLGMIQELDRAGALPKGSSVKVESELGDVTYKGGEAGSGGLDALGVIEDWKQMNKAVREKLGPGWVWTGQEPKFLVGAYNAHLTEIGQGTGLQKSVGQRKEFVKRELTGRTETKKLLEQAYGMATGRPSGIDRNDFMRVKDIVEEYGGDADALKKDLDEATVRVTQLGQMLDGLTFSHAALARLTPEQMGDIWYGLTTPAARAAVAKARAAGRKEPWIVENVVGTWTERERGLEAGEQADEIEAHDRRLKEGPGGAGGAMGGDQFGGGNDMVAPGMATDEGSARARLQAAGKTPGEIEATIRSLRSKGLIQ